MTTKLQVGTVITAPKLGQGKWIVIKAEESGGSTNWRDPWPDGWHLTMVEVEDNIKDTEVIQLSTLTKEKKKSFYQDGFGCFNRESSLGDYEIVCFYDVHQVLVLRK